MADLYVGRTFQKNDSLARYRCLVKDRDGLYVLRSMRSPNKLIVLREIDLITKWKVIA